MQTPLLPLPTIGANAAAAPKVSLNAGGQDHQFQRALSREMEQRQSTMADSKPAARAPERRPAGPSAPRQAAPAKQAQPASPHDADMPVQPGARSAPAVTSGTPATGKEQDSAPDDSQSDAQAAMDGPVADMLALVAAFNPPPAPAGAVAGAAGAQAGLPADQAAALASEAGAALPDGAAATAATDPALALAQAAADQAGTSDTFQATLAQATGHADAKADAKLAAAGTAEAAVAADAGTGQAGPDDGNAALGQFSATDGAAAAAGAGQHKTKAAADVATLPAGGERTAPDNAIPIIKAQPAEASTVLKAAMAAEPAAAATAPIAPAAVAGLEIAKAAASVPADKLAARVGTPGWDQQLGQKIVFMAAGGEQSATMELNPPDLGPMQVVLSVSNDHATVAFTSAQPEVRQALEAAVPKLREMMSDAGIQLGNATVSAGTGNQDNGYNQQAASAQSGGGGGSGGGQGGPRYGRDSAEPAPRSAAPIRRLPAGAVDTFA
ncbi:MAG: flagellar hook-length control protein FliK [Pseudomonadota bacterium]